ncbi:hypothetical protein CDL12_08281 [Handroanthus impetiginosus]|uniref:Wall-associated receptor kinase galacturonan-binding domain-containing protein n=1 Tax=Handroanthus impetiginosus TaxID=429701 RepID=A0A2G9HNC9_9LAMI|nr:hypothetical protein CDL12_08281 [Handroanthus impetiginosus]
MAINKFMILVLLPIIFISKPVVSISNFSLATPNCKDHCGNIPIPYPFSITENSISLDGQIHVLQYIAHDCYAPNGTSVSSNSSWIGLPYHFTVKSTANKFTIIGCDSYGFVSGTRLNRTYSTGCTASCNTKDDLLEGPCNGLGCCQTTIPKDIWHFQVDLYSFGNYTNVSDFNRCGYGFVVEESVFFSPENLTNLRDVKEFPMVVDWGIENKSCLEAQKNTSSYACKSSNSECSDPSNGVDYRCFCKKGYKGNPYLPHGCQDIDECKDPISTIAKGIVRTKKGVTSVLAPKGIVAMGEKMAMVAIVINHLNSNLL